MKVCNKCKEEKEDSCFYRRKTGRDAGYLLSWCRKCVIRDVTEKNRERRLRNLDINDITVQLDKKCIRCWKHKPFEEFYLRKTGKAAGKRVSECKECRAIINRKVNYQMKAYYRYGITREEKDRMLESQKSRCVICNRHESELRRKLNLDHNHKTGEVRGLLCDKCNTGLGGVEENIFEAVRYLGLEKCEFSEIDLFTGDEA